MECIECPLCFRVFNSDTVRAHCFAYCGHVACLSCIQQLTMVGCHMNCSLPPCPPNRPLPVPENAFQISLLNVWITRRVYMDFTNVAHVQRNLTQKEEELAQKKEELAQKKKELVQKKKELAQKERTIRELKDQLREVHLDRAVCSRLLDDERARHDGESHAALIGAMTEKLAQLELELKSFFTPVERVDAAVSADAVAPSPNPYTSWRSRGVQVNLFTSGESIISQEPSHNHAVAVGPSIVHAQQSTSSSVSVGNSQTASGSTQPQDDAHGNSSQQLDVSEPSSPDSGPQSEPSSRNSTPSPVSLRPMTNAERAYLIDSDPQEPDAGSSSTGSQAPQSPPALQFNPGPSAQSGASSPIPGLDPPMFVLTAGPSAQGTRSRHQGRGGGNWNASTHNRR